MSKLIASILLELGCVFFQVVMAAQDVGLGRVSTHIILEPMTYASHFINTVCLAVGLSFLFASVIKYVEHKRSPLMVPMSTVVFLLISGILLVLLPFVAVITKQGVRYFYHR